MREADDELTIQERTALTALPREKSPPPSLEERIVSALKNEGLIRSPKQNSRWLSRRLIYGMAASLVVCFLGLGIGVWWRGGFSRLPASTTTAANQKSEFMLVLNSLPNQYADDSPEEAQLIAEYRSWANRIGEKGLLVGGEKLESDVRRLKIVNGQMQVNTIDAVANENGLAGYFLIRATDYEQAIEIARGCPHLQHGGTVEVRRIYHQSN